MKRSKMAPTMIDLCKKISILVIISCALVSPFLADVVALGNPPKRRTKCGKKVLGSPPNTHPDSPSLTFSNPQP